MVLKRERKESVGPSGTSLMFLACLCGAVILTIPIISHHRGILKTADGEYGTPCAGVMPLA